MVKLITANPGDVLSRAWGRVVGRLEPGALGDVTVIAASDGADPFKTVIEATEEDVKLVVVGGRPIREPLAWAGPFVMNTKSEVLQAYEDFQKGRFGHIPAG